MKVLFFGTPDIAAASLAALCEHGYHVVGAVTQPDKPQGRSMRMTPPAVKEYALQHNIRVYQPVTLKDGALLPVLQELEPDVIVVIAYGKILPEYILNYPKYGCINIHASLLPKLRGAGPIQWAIINGERETGVTTMYMEKGLDTGDMILDKRIAIGPDETAGELFDRMCALGAEVILETLPLVERGEAPRRPQCEEEASYAPMLDKKLARIDFQKDAQTLKNQIRGMNPWPVAYTSYGAKKLKIFSADVVEGPHLAPGEALSAQGKLLIGCGDGRALAVTRLQLEGARAMDAQAFLAGHPIAEPMMLGTEE